jgi:long-chain acyl-CoA synthetase
MATLGDSFLKLNPIPNRILDSGELPLERIYACEQARGSALFLTQPMPNEVREWTWLEAMREARQMAAWLKAQNWPPGSRIVILSKNCAWWLMADFAIWMAGHVSVPLFPAANSKDLTALIAHCEPVACFLGRYDHPLPFEDAVFRNVTWIGFPYANAVPAESCQWAEIVRTEEPLAESPTRDAMEIATIIYTSGSTGKPKGAMHTFQGLSLMGKSMEPTFQHKRKGVDRTLSYLPLAHIAERAIVEMNVLFSPMEIYFVESQETFLKDLGRARATVFFSVPLLFIRFQQKVFEKIPAKKLERLLAIPLVNRLVRRKIVKRLGLDHARLVAGGGAATPVDLILWYRKLGLNFVEGYGMTESGITHVPLPGQFRPGYVGHASACADTRISTEGEVQIAGAMNMVGYFRSPELSRMAFTEDGYLRTGDRGEIDSMGRLRLVGRLKEEFKTDKGKYVVPTRIEELLARSTLFESVAVFGAGMHQPFALAVLVAEKREASQEIGGRTAIGAEIRALLKEVNAELDAHEKLRFLTLCAEPWTVQNQFLTPTLKVRRGALEQHFSDRFKIWERLNREVVWLEKQ